MKKRKGITLLALVITIIVILLIAGIALQFSLGENGLIAKAEKSKRDNAKSELFDVATMKFSSMSIDDVIDKTDTLNFATLYNSKDFKDRYEIKDDKIYDKGIKENIISKTEFEENFRDKFRMVGRETQKPLVNPINNNSTELTGVGERGAEITVTVNGGVEKKTTVDNSGNWRVQIGIQTVGTEIKIIQKSNGKVESIETKVIVQKEKLPRVAVNPLYNTSTAVEGNGVPGATVKVIDNHGNEKTALISSTGQFSIGISNIVEDTIISVLQTMNDKEDSDIETIVVQKGKGTQPSVNPVDSDDTNISGTGVAGSTIIVRIDGVGEYRATVNNSGNWAISIPVQQQGKIIRIAQEQPRRTPSDEVVISVVRAPEPLVNPHVNTLYNDHHQITGRGESGATIVVRIDGAGELRTTVDGAGNWYIATEVFLNIPGGRGIHVRQEKAGRPNSPETNITLLAGISRNPEITYKEGTNYDESKHVIELRGKGIAGSRIIVGMQVPGKNMWPFMPNEHTVNVDGSGNWIFKIEHNQTGYSLYTVYVRQIETGKHSSATLNTEVYARLIQHTFGPGFGSAHGRRRIR